MSPTDTGKASPRPGRRKESVLTGPCLDGLLAALDADRDVAGQKYETLRKGVTRFFEWRGSRFPEDHADETIDRVARKLSEGASVRNIHAYVAGVARFVWKELGRAPGEAWRGAGELPRELPAAQPRPHDPRLECVDRCLEALDAEGRELIMAYYEDEKRDKIERRRRLAERLGLAPGTLRMRAHRLRARLEECVRECVQRLPE